MKYRILQKNKKITSTIKEYDTKGFLLQKVKTLKTKSKIKLRTLAKIKVYDFKQ